LIPLLIVAAIVAALVPAISYAQKGRAGHGARTVYVGYYSPFFPAYGWYPWYPYPFAGYPPYGFYGEPTGSVRLQVSPRDAEVFVDGYYAGIVDDFDGLFQRLNVRPGPHEIVLYHEKYRAIRQTLYVAIGTDYKIRQELTQLSAGETAEPRPVPTSPAPGFSNVFGALSIRVQPADAVILVDGEEWRSPEPQGRLVVQLSEGVHRIEIRKDGHITFSSTVDVRRGETTTLNVVLPSAR
jgi:hypothetical protein